MEEEEATIDENETNEETDALERSFLYFVNDFADEERGIWIGQVFQDVVLEDGMQLECMSFIAFPEGLDYVVVERSLPEFTKQGKVDSFKADVKATFQSQGVQVSSASLTTFKRRKRYSPAA